MSEHFIEEDKIGIHHSFCHEGYFLDIGGYTSTGFAWSWRLFPHEQAGIDDRDDTNCTAVGTCQI